MIKSILHEGEKLKKALKIGGMAALGAGALYGGHKFLNSGMGQRAVETITPIAKDVGGAILNTGKTIGNSLLIGLGISRANQALNSLSSETPKPSSDNHLGAQGRHMAHNTEAKNKTPWQQRHEDQSPSPSQKEWNSEKAYRRTLMTSTKDNDLAELARGNKSIPINRPMTNSKYLLKKDGGVSTLGLVKSAIEHPEHLKMNL